MKTYDEFVEDLRRFGGHLRILGFDDQRFPWYSGKVQVGNVYFQHYQNSIDIDAYLLTDEQASRLTLERETLAPNADKIAAVVTDQWALQHPEISAPRFTGFRYLWSKPWTAHIYSRTREWKTVWVSVEIPDDIGDAAEVERSVSGGLDRLSVLISDSER